MTLVNFVRSVFADQEPSSASPAYDEATAQLAEVDARIAREEARIAAFDARETASLETDATLKAERDSLLLDADDGRLEAVARVGEIKRLRSALAIDLEEIQATRVQARARLKQLSEPQATALRHQAEAEDLQLHEQQLAAAKAADEAGARFAERVRTVIELDVLRLCTAQRLGRTERISLIGRVSDALAYRLFAMIPPNVHSFGTRFELDVAMARRATTFESVVPPPFAPPQRGEPEHVGAQEDSTS